MTITIKGQTRRAFTFPAKMPDAFRFYCNAPVILKLLPHISLTHTYGPDCFRMLYSTTELGVYRIRLYCDVRVQPDLENRTLRFIPFDGSMPVEPESGLSTSTGQGHYSSESVFHDEGSQTRVDYSLQLNASLPAPLSAIFMPPGVRDAIAAGITDRRIREIAGGFIERSIRLYNHKA
ncbi:MAG: hypothetical protein EHM70_03620 [Chloroflexota bacterium]|nr:MAG: hypothetical protein EHM70_03620 [Chloroflexota bacterium]